MQLIFFYSLTTTFNAKVFHFRFAVPSSYFLMRNDESIGALRNQLCLRKHFSVCFIYSVPISSASCNLDFYVLFHIKFAHLFVPVLKYISQYFAYVVNIKTYYQSNKLYINIIISFE